MRIPIKAKITLAIIAGIGIGTGLFVMGLLMMLGVIFPPRPVGGAPVLYTGLGSGILASSIAALIAHLVGGFRDIEEEP